MIHVLYNPLSHNKKASKSLKQLETRLQNEEYSLSDITKANIAELFDSLPENDTVIVSGGDGTLHHFVNNINPDNLMHKVYYCPSGSGNDFVRDLNEPLENGMVLLNPYIKNLPLAIINGKKYRFLNGIGYGIDGYCCDELSRLKEKYKINFSYALIGLKGLLFGYKPSAATLEIDGEVFNYDHVWMTPSMKGKYFGGGVKIAPMQDRKNKEGLITTVVATHPSAFKILTIFPTIFSGKHVKYKDVIKFHTGKNIKVTYDKATSLQIDGEVMRDVLSYSIRV